MATNYVCDKYTSFFLLRRRRQQQKKSIRNHHHPLRIIIFLPPTYTTTTFIIVVPRNQEFLVTQVNNEAATQVSKASMSLVNDGAKANSTLQEKKKSKSKPRLLYVGLHLPCPVSLQAAFETLCKWDFLLFLRHLFIRLLAINIWLWREN